MNVFEKVPWSCVGDDELPSSNVTLCEVQVCPVYTSPVHEFHDHWTVLPIATVLVAGLKKLLLTEIPPAGGGVLPEGGGVEGPEL